MAARLNWTRPGRICSWPSITISRFADCFADARKFLSESIRVSQDITTRSLQRIASRMASGGFPQVVVFNPVSWRRQSWIEVPVAFERGYAKGLEVRHEGKIVPAVILSADSYSDGSLREAKLAVLADLDGLSVGAFELRPAPAGCGGEQPRRDARGQRESGPHDAVLGGSLSSGWGPVVDQGPAQRDRSFCGRRRRVVCSPGRIDGQDMISKGHWVPGGGACRRDLGRRPPERPDRHDSVHRWR